MKVKDVRFLKSVFSAASFPALPYPEFAFMGRSNVGKSSLINMLTAKKDLVKTGSRPGVTKSVNFFILNGGITLTDLPGFGYARLPESVRGGFLPLIKSYVEKRDNLRLVFLLVDIRRVPGDFEREMITLLAGRGVPVAVVATKCDKLTRNRRLASARAIAEALSVGIDSIFFSSSKTNDGRKEMLGLIDEYSRRGAVD
jgi:GTP-binding protein